MHVQPQETRPGCVAACMHVRFPVAALAALGALTLSAPVIAAPTPTTYYFKCVGPSKVQNGSAIFGQPAWSLTKPTASFQSGAGCGFADPQPPQGSNVPTNAYDAYFGGTHGGAFVEAQVELHNLVASRIRQGTTNVITARLNVGGTEVANRTYTLTGVPSSTGATEMFKFTIDGLEIEADDPTRPIILTIGVVDAAGVWVMDAAEIPASMTLIPPPEPAAP